MSNIQRGISLVTVAVLGGVTAAVLGLGSGQRPRPAATAERTENGAAANQRSNVADATAQAIDPALFSTGSCMAFAPTRGDRHRTVFLDAGHGGIDPGAVGITGKGRTVTEARVNLPIELDAMALLRARGYRVVVSRTRPSTVIRLGRSDTTGRLFTIEGSHEDVTSRAVCANMARASILIGIYMNAGSAAAAGCLTAYDPDRPFAAANLRLATLVQRDVLGGLNASGFAIPDGGVRSDIGLGSALTSAGRSYGHLLLLGPAKAGYFATPSQMPGALIEPLFITDPFEASIAASSRGQRVIAAGLAKAVDQYFAR